jgi:hypothetical protein
MIPLLLLLLLFLLFGIGYFFSAAHLTTKIKWEAKPNRKTFKPGTRYRFANWGFSKRIFSTVLTSKGDKVVLVRDTWNEYEASAIKVYSVKYGRLFRDLGYVSSGLLRELRCIWMQVPDVTD